VDKRRIRRVFGRITKGELTAVDSGLGLFLGLEPWTRDFNLRRGGAPAKDRRLR
jgi:hypothetical protein